MRHVSFPRLLVTAAGAAAIIAATARCTDGDRVQGPTPPDRAAFDASTARSASPRLATAKARTAWMAELHTAAMQELTRDRRAIAKLRRAPRSEQCAAVWTLTKRYAPLAAARAGARLGREIAGLARDRMRAIGCPDGAYDSRSFPEAATPMSLFGAAQTEEVTEAVFNYFPSLDATFYYMESPGGAAGSSDAVLSDASWSLGWADLDLLAGMAGLGVSSAYYWYDYEASGGFDTRICDDPASCPGGEEPYSLFMQSGRRWRSIGYADLAGGLACVGAAWFSGYRDPRGLFAAGVICSVLNSAAAAL